MYPDHKMTTQDFIFDVPLYQWVVEDTDTIVHQLQFFVWDANIPLFEGYNPIRKVDSTYQVYRGIETRHNIESQSGLGHVRDQFWQDDNLWYVTLECKRYGDKLHLMLLLRAEDHAIMKVGQYPSVASLHIAKVKQYNNILDKEDAKEFAKAIGLAANGVGIGSFVYLRRIFENLIYKSAEQAILDGEITEDTFSRLRMEEKINAIKNYLPETLVEIKSIYGILSKGIHELSEEECLGYFDVMRNSIELILDEILERKKKARKKAEIKKSIDTIKGNMNN